MLLCTAILGVLAGYARHERALGQVQVDFAARQVASNIRHMVKAREQTLELAARILADEPFTSSKDFERRLESLDRRAMGFDAIKWVEPSGVIKWSSPADRGAFSAGSNVSKRKESARCLERASATKSLQMTGVIPTYANVPGLLLFAPVIARDGSLQGFLNGVFVFERALVDGLMAETHRDFALRATLDGVRLVSVDAGVQYGQEGDLEGRSELNLHDHEIQVSLNLRDESLAGLWRRVAVALAVGGSLLAAVLLYCALALGRRLRLQTRRERRANAMMNLLCHDLANPLTATRHVAEMALLGKGEAAIHLNNILSGIDKQSQILHRVREMRALELGRKRLVLRPTPMREMLGELEVTFAAQLEAKQIRLVIDGDVDECVLVDKVAFEHNVLNNLVSNAIKFSEHGSIVWVETRRDGDAVHVMIRDEGVGMSGHVLRGLFLEGGGGTLPGTAGERGTGIGMLQVKSYMDGFGGKVEVESRWRPQHPHDHGTTFRLTLRWAEAPSAGSAHKG